MESSKVRLLPGVPDDDNRDYLPEKLKGTQFVVNENGNNSQPYPQGLREFHEKLTSMEGEDVWYEYVPESYDPAKKTPLVLSMHGGLMTGWGQAVYTSWTMMAERDGFIVVFPDAHYDRVWSVQWGKWNSGPDMTTDENPDENPPTLVMSPDNIAENRDVQMALALIEKMKEKYNIDEGRIYMQGMSMGNLMTALFARNYGNLLAGAAGSGCSTFPSLLYDEQGKIKNQAGPVPVWQSRPELNDIPPDKEESLRVNKENRLYWMALNGCDPVPQIKIEGEDNLAFYTGDKGDVVYLDIKNRDHGQTLDDAALIWDYFFSGLRREKDGSITRLPTVFPREGDKFALAFAADCAAAWQDNQVAPLGAKAVLWQKLKYHGLEGGQKVRGEYLCVPLRFLAQAFGASYETEEEGLRGVMTLKDGRVLQFARGSIGCVIDDVLRSMYCEALYREGELLVSVEWFCQYLFDLHVSSCDGVVYVTDHWAALSANMADLLKDLLKGQAAPEGFPEALL